MAVIVIENNVSKPEIKIASDDYGQYIKIVADLDSQIITIGGEWHSDGEKLLLERGSIQKNLWGGGISLNSKKIDYTALINIRPQDNNDSMEILDATIRNKFEKIVREKFEL